MRNPLIVSFLFISFLCSNSWAVTGKRYLHPFEAVLNSGHVYPTYRLILENVDTFFSESPQSNVNSGESEDETQKLILQKLDPHHNKAAKRALDNHAGLAILHATQFPKHNKLVKKRSFILNSGEDLVKFIQTPYLKYNQVHEETAQSPESYLIEDFHHFQETQDLGAPHPHRFTYVILPTGEMFFSETGKNAGKDLISKHVILAGGTPEIIYAGEFYFLSYKNETYLIMNNGSGTYRPNTENNVLSRLQALMQANFANLKVISKSYKENVTESDFVAHFQQ
jgi:hypothetical protein